MHIEIAKIVLNESMDVNQIIVKIQPGRNADDVAAMIEQLLIQRHSVTAQTEEFTITTASFFQLKISGVTSNLDSHGAVLPARNAAKLQPVEALRYG